MDKDLEYTLQPAPRLPKSQPDPPLSANLTALEPAKEVRHALSNTEWVEG